MGMGAVPLYTIGVTFLDEIANPKYIHVYLGLFYVFAALGSGIGFLLGSQFLALYVNPGTSDHPDADNPNFVGRWWAGYVLTGVCAIAISLPLLMYPRRLPNTAWIMEEKRKKQTGTGQSVRTGHESFGKEDSDSVRSVGVMASLKRALREFTTFLHVVLLLFLSPVLLFTTFGGVTESFAVSMDMVWMYAGSWHVSLMSFAACVGRLFFFQYQCVAVQSFATKSILNLRVYRCQQTTCTYVTSMLYAWHNYVCPLVLAVCMHEPRL